MTLKPSVFRYMLFVGLLLVLLAQSGLVVAPSLLKAADSTDTYAGLQDLVASISSDNLVNEVASLNQYSRCLNSPGHDEAAAYIQNRLRTLGVNPIVQKFSSNAAGVRNPQLQNIIVRLPGTSPRAVHLLTAHYDSSPNRTFPPLCDGPSPGANDNGSGTAVLLELARLFGQGRARFTDDLELVFFDGEEFGYLGSDYFVRQYDSSKEINPNRVGLGAVINMDMVGYPAEKGNGKVWAVAQGSASLGLAQEGSGIVSKYWPSARYNVYTIGTLFPAGSDPNRLSDQSVFWKANKGAAIFLTEDVSDAAGLDPRYHTPGDKLYNSDGSMRLDPALIADSARVAIAIAGQKAGPQPSRFFDKLNSAFERNWSRADRPVLVGSESSQPAERSWLWGPTPNQIVEEPYDDAPGGARQVAYFDKARMELRTAGANITNGLLVREMATGALQLGDTRFIERSPSQVPVAGDPNQQGQNPNAPTYASFKNLVESGPVASAEGKAVSATLSKNGTVGNNGNLGGYAKNAAFIPNTGHNIPDVFWNWFQSQGRVYDPVNDRYTNGKIFDWIETVGYPISEAYWVRAKVAGKEQDVLVQLFERRVLTYNPANDPAFRVEMGNVGLHYYSWRYNNDK